MSEERKYIHREIYSSNHFNESDFNGTALNLKEWLEQFPDDTHINLNAYSSYNNKYIRVDVYQRRLETQAECDKRIEKDAKLDGIRKVRRRELFEDLKREFDG